MNYYCKRYYVINMYGWPPIHPKNLTWPTNLIKT